MARRDRGLQRVGAFGGAEGLRPGQCRVPPVDEEAVPRAAVLVQEEDGGAGGAGAGAQARGVELHQGNQSVYLGLFGRQGGEDPAQPEGFRAQLGAQPVVAGGGRVTLVEDQVDDLEHRPEPGGAIVTARHLERDAGLGDRLLGADDALGDGGLGDDVGACDLGHGEAPDEAQGERDPRRHGQDRMARDEDETELVVLDLLLRFDVGQRLHPGRAVGLERTTQLRVLCRQRAVAAEEIDRLPLGDGGQPRTRIGRDAVSGPLAESIDQRLLGQVLGQPDVTDAAGEGGDDTRELNPVDRLNGGGRIGGRHASDSTTPPFRPPGPIERFPLRLTGRGGRGPHPRPARRGTAWTTRLPRPCRGTP